MPLHEIRIERVFHATHALRLYDGTMEEPHAHDWRLFVYVHADRLDAMEVVMDFHELERIVDGVLKPLDDADLNAAPLFSGVNPSAERVVEVIYKEIAAQLPSSVKLAKCVITEAPGCRAAYWQ